MLAAVLAATTAAGCLLALLLLPLNELDPASIILTLWVIAAPPVAMVASLCLLFDARRWTRGPLGEVLFFAFWMGSLVFVMASGQAGGYAANMTDLPGSAPIHLDVMSGVLADGYLVARLTWFGIAALDLCAPCRRHDPQEGGLAQDFRAGEGAPSRSRRQARRSRKLPGLALVLAEARLMAGGRLGLLAMCWRRQPVFSCHILRQPGRRPCCCWSSRLRPMRDGASRRACWL